MELSDQLKKELKKYCLLLHAYSDTSWTTQLWFEADDDYIERFSKILFNNHRTNQVMEVPPIIKNFLEDLRSNLNFDEIYEIWPGENYCRGYLIFKFEPEDELFELVIDFEVEKVEFIKFIFYSTICFYFKKSKSFFLFLILFFFLQLIFLFSPVTVTVP